MKQIVGVLGWLGVGLVVAALALRILRPDLGYHQWIALAGLIVTAVYALSQWRDIARSFQGKNVKFGSVAVGGILLVLATIVAINWISSRNNKRWDLTANQTFSLSDQTRQLLTELKEPVQMRVYYEGDAQRIRDQLAEYSYISGQMQVQYFDVIKDPIPAQNDKVTQVPTVVIEYGGRTERATVTDEQGLTNAMKKVIVGQAKKLYFVQGHGERDTAASDANGYSLVAQRLANDNFEVAKLTLAQEGKVPADATVVIAAGPRSDYFPAEIDALRDFLKRGGKLLILLDPVDRADAPQVTGLITLAKEWGIEIGNDIVFDLNPLQRVMGTNESVPIAMPLQHPANGQVREMTAYPLTRAVTPVEGGTNGRFAQKVVETGPNSWAETDLKGLFATRKVERNLDKGDKPGPISLAAAATAPAADAPPGPTPDAPKPESRVLVVGDSDFLTNRGIRLAGNENFGLNLANWLAQQENLIAIRPRDPEDRRIQLTEDQGTVIRLLSWFIIPGLLFGNAVRVWWKRR